MGEVIKNETFFSSNVYLYVGMRILGNNELNFIRDKILESGFPLQFYVSSILNRYKWQVYPNTYFLDKDEMKGRELDIKAESDMSEINTSLGFLGIKIILLIECKKIPGNAWVFFKGPSDEVAPISSHSTLDYLRHRQKDFSFLSSSYGNIRFSFEMPTHFDKMFIDFTKSEKRFGFTVYDEVIIDEKESNKRTDNLWSSIMTLVKAMSQTEQDFIASDEFSEKGGYLIHSIQKGSLLFDIIKFVLPVIVFEGRLFEASYEEELQLKKQDYVPLTINYKSGNYEGEYCIEVVHKNFFEEYLKIIKNDQEVLEKRANENAVQYLNELKESLEKYFLL